METESFQQFSALQRGFIDPKEFIINLFIASIISWVLSITYKQCGSSPSDKASFAKNFLLLSTTTMLIITVVKSSLALSLGLVGALSIVRFRSAIKEPEELTFLFLSMTVGLGLGANQREITILGVGFILALFVVRHIFHGNKNPQSYHVVVSMNDDLTSNKSLDTNNVEKIVNTIKEHCNLVQLKRVDSSNAELEVAFAVEISEYSKLTALKDSIQKLNPSARFTFMDLRGLVN